ncbi:MAG TPA: AbrB/MazE/SpoVT family DNA-binding domain-containing protein [Bacteroidales bacterium]|nr:AbrB/MazE/SpoVT family DNA-binding domain-containing protein [Bacteroidales bacterium]HRZ76704.1 AbrB/MazE/SpoVT family DNA-binding domain-containing protein [Bacteroidales bacterium]
MKIPIIPIGNSKGIRLSKTLIEKYDFKDSVELILNEEYLIIKPVVEPRINWESAFKEMHENGDDKLIIPDVFEDEDLEL